MKIHRLFPTILIKDAPSLCYFLFLYSKNIEKDVVLLKNVRLTAINSSKNSTHREIYIVLYDSAEKKKKILWCFVARESIYKKEKKKYEGSLK